MSGQCDLPDIENNTGITTAYTGLFLLIPVLNFYIACIKKTIELVVMLGIVLYFCIAELFRRDIFVTKEEGESPIWMIVLYIIGGYLGKYQGWKKKSNDTLVLFISYA